MGPNFIFGTPRGYAGNIDRRSVVALFDQILEGRDVPTPHGLLSVAEARRDATPDCAPYSIHLNLAHAVLWQEHWLAKLAGRSRLRDRELWVRDWEQPDPVDWATHRRRFIEGLRDARTIAAAEPFAHEAGTDTDAVALLLRIAIHAVYHMGQINALKRMASRGQAPTGRKVKRSSTSFPPRGPEITQIRPVDDCS